MPDLLTVLVLTYNHEESIAKALDSILEQRTNFDFSIHVAEDCSIDQTQNILNQYSERYPNRIKLFMNKFNKGVVENCYEALLRIQTKYFAFLEGDDCWCDSNKLQKQIDVLEGNPDCSLCGHDTIVHNLLNGGRKRFIGKNPVKNKYIAEDSFRVHPSSRVYRNIVDFKKVPKILIYDTAIYLLFLDKGKLYYLDEIMSVYNITGKGIWSGKNKVDRQLLAINVAYETQKFFNFRYDNKFYPNYLIAIIIKKIIGEKVANYLYFRYKKIKIKLI